MSIQTMLWVFCFWQAFASILGYDYCKHPACPGQHTMCTYPDKKKCKTKESGMTNKDRETLLKWHNELRQKVAQGKENGQPAASNMMKLYWDMEVEKIAQRWADQCTFGHDACRAPEGADNAGQNIAKGYDSRKDKDAMMKHLFEKWYGEVQYVDAEALERYSDPDATKPRGHYTQMVWAASTRMGCGKIIKEEHSELLIVCNFVEAGNFINAPIYKQGDACSACPEKTKCSKRYPGLCTGEKDEYKDVPKAKSNEKDKGKGKGAPSITYLSPLFMTAFAIVPLCLA